jgi:hypothetical protein
LWRNHRAAVLAVGALAAVALVVAVIWPITDLIAAHDVATITGPSRPLHLQTAREAVRTQLLTLGAGLFAAGALIYTARNFTLSRERQVTDSFNTAIDHLGSSRLDVRIGGIYALQRIAYGSGRDHPTVMQVLCTFIREHSHEPWPANKDGNLLKRLRRGGEQKTRPDVQAALFVIGYRNAKSDNQVMDLNHASLRWAIFDGMSINSRRSQHEWVAKQEPSAWLDAVDFTHATLKGVNFEGASLRGAKFIDADLSPNDRHTRHPKSANFIGANLIKADFTRADLTRADLTDAKRSKDDARLDDWECVRDPDSDEYQRLKRRNSDTDGSSK